MRISDRKLRFGIDSVQPWPRNQRQAGSSLLLLHRRLTRKLRILALLLAKLVRGCPRSQRNQAKLRSPRQSPRAGPPQKTVTQVFLLRHCVPEKNHELVRRKTRRSCSGWLRVLAEEV